LVVGEWTVEPRLNRISRGDCELRLEPRVMDLLAYLAERAGEVASREEIIDALWREQCVADSVLTRAVSLLRNALGDDPHAPRYVETIAKRGYRLVAPVTRGDPSTRNDVIPIVTIGDRQWLLEAEECIVGRGPQATIRLDQPRVSRRHARIRRTPDGTEIEDLGSKNGTRVNGVPVAAPAPLEDGDQIVIGPVVLVYREPWATSTVTAAGSTSGSVRSPTSGARATDDHSVS
jgi:DNA-binding winged helix-turn-helix (wHTH) protein